MKKLDFIKSGLTKGRRKTDLISNKASEKYSEICRGPYKYFTQLDEKIFTFSAHGYEMMQRTKSMRFRQ